MKQIINSLLDTDLYKFTMQQSAIRQFSDVWVKYVFTSRNPLEWNKTLYDELLNQIDNFCSLSFNTNELEYLASLRFIKRDYIEFLKLYRPLREHVKVQLIDNKLDLQIEGPWYQTILWEIPILAMISEIYYDYIIKRDNIAKEVYAQGKNNLLSKINDKLLKTCDKYDDFMFSEFGTRRRFSFDWHSEAVEILKSKSPNNSLIGTSNVYLAKKYDLLAVGTNAHEYYQVGQALSGVQLGESQKYMLQAWINEYRGDLGIALSDTLGTKKFLKDFDIYFAKLYDGVRHDSGDPIKWGNIIIDHYKSMRIDPKTKILLFSDSLDFDKALDIHSAFSGKTNVTFGIGTYLMNDFKPILSPLNIVMKLQSVNGRPVAKISDDEGKTICEDEDFLHYLKKVSNE